MYMLRYCYRQKVYIYKYNLTVNYQKSILMLSV